MSCYIPSPDLVSTAACLLQIQGGERCRSLRAACDMRLQLLGLLQRGPTDGLVEQRYSYSDLLEGARECDVEYTATCGG